MCSRGVVLAVEDVHSFEVDVYVVDVSLNSIDNVIPRVPATALVSPYATASMAFTTEPDGNAVEMVVSAENYSARPALPRDMRFAVVVV